MLCLLFGIYLLGHSVFTPPRDDHYAYIPESAHYLIEVHTEAIFEQTTSDLLSSDEDSSLLRLLQDKLGETKWSDLSSNGIDPRADILLFACEEKGKPLFGQLLVVEDEQNFRGRYLASLDNDSKCAVIKGNTALILWQTEAHFKARELQKIATKLLNGKHRTLEAAHDNGLIHLHSFAQKKSRQSTIHCRTADNMLRFDGEMEFIPENPSNEKLRALKPEGFHFTSRFVPAFISELSGFELPLPMEGISVLSMNYRGLEINTDQSPQILPDLDLLLHFKGDFPVRHFLDSLAEIKLINTLENGSFLCAGVQFYYRQIESNQVYIGRQTMGELQALEQNEAFRLSGSVADLTRMKTSGLIGRFIEILPAYIATQECAANCESLQMNGILKGNRIKIDGSLTFKEGHYFTTELLRFLLLGKFM